MKFVVDKNTNRMIYAVPLAGKYLLDEHTYLVEGEAFPMTHSAWSYRYVDRAFVYVEPKIPAAPKPKPLNSRHIVQRDTARGPKGALRL